MRMVIRGFDSHAHEASADMQRPVNMLVRLLFAHVGREHAQKGHEQLKNKEDDGRVPTLKG